MKRVYLPAVLWYCFLAFSNFSLHAETHAGIKSTSPVSDLSQILPPSNDYNTAYNQRSGTTINISMNTGLRHSFSIPPVPVVTGLIATYCNTGGTERGKIMNLPADSSNIIVDVRLDGSPLTVDADSTFSFPVYALAIGPHIITVAFLNEEGGESVTHHFDILAATAPNVSLSANITNILSLATPVVVTAGNAAGGGDSPLYTFASDRNFTHILQAESDASILNVDPAMLAIGENWVYVKMKSSAVCVVTDIDTDSIKLVRDISTGITDPDNPGKVITVYPNPFSHQIYIKGLSPAKTYILTVINIHGQLIEQHRIANSNNAALVFSASKSGHYLLRVIDEKSRRLVGTLPLIKR